MCSLCFRKCGVTTLATCMQVSKKDDIADTKGMGITQKGMAHKHDHDKTGSLHNVAQHAADTVNKCMKGKILAKRINVHTVHEYPHSQKYQSK